MSWRVFTERHGGADTSEFKRAISMMKEGLDRICDLSEEMEDRYSERRAYREREDYPGDDAYRHSERRYDERHDYRR